MQPIQSETKDVIADLQAWLTSHGVSLEHFQIKYTGPEAGHCVVAAKDFIKGIMPNDDRIILRICLCSHSYETSAGEHALDIPFNLTMNVQSALASDLSRVFAQECSLPQDEILALHLMYERHKGDASFWAPFIR
jgi:hypothetical protein